MTVSDPRITPAPGGPPQAIFVSDVHLMNPADLNYQRMLAFLETHQGVPQLFIVGDFFDFWYGYKDVVQSRYVQVLAALERLVAGGTRIHFIEGNHDFCMGEFFQRTLGAEVHRESTEVTLGGKRLYLAHGDLIDRQDKGYLRLRALLRSGPARLLARWAPPRVSLALARGLETTAGGDMAMSGHLPELFRGFARDKWAEGYDGVILGHCHAPELSWGDGDNRGRFYANLGDWLRHYTYLSFDGEGFSLGHLS